MSSFKDFLQTLVIGLVVLGAIGGGVYYGVPYVKSFIDSSSAREKLGPPQEAIGE